MHNFILSLCFVGHTFVAPTRTDIFDVLTADGPWLFREDAS